jgi:hypothetical protein
MLLYILLLLVPIYLFTTGASSSFEVTYSTEYEPSKQQWQLVEHPYNIVVEKDKVQDSDGQWNIVDVTQNDIDDNCDLFLITCGGIRHNNYKYQPEGFLGGVIQFEDSDTIYKYYDDYVYNGEESEVSLMKVSNENAYITNTERISYNGEDYIICFQSPDVTYHSDVQTDECHSLTYYLDDEKYGSKGATLVSLLPAPIIDRNSDADYIDLYYENDYCIPGYIFKVDYIKDNPMDAANQISSVLCGIDDDSIIEDNIIVID